ncbi:chromate transporter [Clostridium intestinale]|uniref:chromate transporter n=1 Tax=Clostridium intestinale TaxID=36845 RepID=UPI002DD63906|nr:chromate transporter [Clostridium intestinale]WRY51328.1 chromate transporter [Clostridium intestinale]
MILFNLFWSFFKIGLFSFGGGYAVIPLIQTQVVYNNNWLTQSEFTDLITISQMTPGPIAINSSTFVGIRVAGLSGAIIATLGCVLPSCIIMCLLAWLYFKYKHVDMVQGILKSLRPLIIALIASAGISIFTLSIWREGNISLNPSDIDFISIILFSLALISLRKTKFNPILIMLSCGLIRFLYFFIYK